MYKQTRSIVLASSSPRRKAFLDRYHLEFKVITSSLEEKIKEGELPVEYASRTAREKADSVVSKCSREEIIISADTIVVFRNKILGKPQSSSDSFAMLKHLNGNTHDVITSYVVYDCYSEEKLQRCISTQVNFLRHPDNLLKSYAESTEPRDKAGGYSIQGIGTFLIASISGSYNNVVGLPIEILLNDLVEKQYLLIA